MKYTPTYFDFDSLEHKMQSAEMLLTVAAIFAVIFVFSYVYSRLPR